MSKKQIEKIIGIDYGSKLAGTSAICFAEEGKLKINQSEKKRDADKFILDFCRVFNPELVFIDAPLSLPAAYFEDQADDYFYRAADRATQAMSPMFIGGLTARAMKLRATLIKQSCEVLETYPKQLVLLLALNNYYKKDLTSFKNALQKFNDFELPIFKNWHQADAALAYTSASRYINGNCQIIGEQTEGRIFI